MLIGKMVTLFLAFGFVQHVSCSEKHVHFTFTFVNGTMVPVVQKKNQEEADTPHSIIRGVFMSLLFLLGLVTSLFLIVTVLASRTLRRFPLNVIVMHLGIGCLLECVLNIAVSVIYSFKHAPWRSSEWGCQLNSWFMEVIPVVFAFILLVLALDRRQALRDPTKYKKTMNVCVTHTAMLILWILAMASTIVVAIGIIKSMPFPDFYSCQVMDEKSLWYGSFALVVLNVFPWIAMLVSLVVIYKAIASEKRKERKNMRGQQAYGNKVSTHTAVFFANAQLWNDLRNVMIAVVLIILFFLFVIPYVVVIRTDQIKQVYDFGYYRNLSNAVYSKEITVSTTAATNQATTNADFTLEDTTTRNEDSSDFEKPSALPEVTDDWLGAFDSVVVWLRYIYFSFAPLLIFLIHRDLRAKTQEFLLACLRPNSVEHAGRIGGGIGGNGAGAARPISMYLKRIEREVAKQKKQFRNITNYNVPVLFATSDGLHMRSVDENEKANPRLRKSSLDSNNWAVEPEFVTEFCDLQLPAESEHLKDSSGDVPTFGSTITVKKDAKAIKQEKLRSSTATSSSSSERSYGYSHKDSQPLIDNDQRENRRIVQFNSKIEEIPRVTLGETVLASDDLKEDRRSIESLDDQNFGQDQKKRKRKSPQRRRKGSDNHQTRWRR